GKNVPHQDHASGSFCFHHPLSEHPPDTILPHTSASVSGRGALPSVSVKPYSSARRAATCTVPVRSMTLGSEASAATARPTNSGDSELLRSIHAAASMTFSVLTSPGYSDTTATPCGASSTAMSADILSVAAFATPYATLPMCFCA